MLGRLQFFLTRLTPQSALGGLGGLSMTPRIQVIKEILLAGATHVAPPTSKPLDRPGFLFFSARMARASIARAVRGRMPATVRRSRQRGGATAGRGASNCRRGAGCAGGGPSAAGGGEEGGTVTGNRGEGSKSGVGNTKAGGSSTQARSAMGALPSPTSRAGEEGARGDSRGRGTSRGASPAHSSVEDDPILVQIGPGG